MKVFSPYLLVNVDEDEMKDPDKIGNIYVPMSADRNTTVPRPVMCTVIQSPLKEGTGAPILSKDTKILVDFMAVANPRLRVGSKLTEAFILAEHILCVLESESEIEAYDPVKNEQIATDRTRIMKPIAPSIVPGSIGPKISTM